MFYISLLSVWFAYFHGNVLKFKLEIKSARLLGHDSITKPDILTRIEERTCGLIG